MSETTKTDLRVLRDPAPSRTSRQHTVQPTREDLEREIAMLRGQLASEQKRHRSEVVALRSQLDAVHAQIAAEIKYSTELAVLNAYQVDQATRARRAQTQLLEEFGSMLAELGDPALQARFDAAARAIAKQSARSLSAILDAQATSFPGPEVPPATDDPFGPVVDTRVGFASGTEPTDRFDETVVQEQEARR